MKKITSMPKKHDKFKNESFVLIFLVIMVVAGLIVVSYKTFGLKWKKSDKNMEIQDSEDKTDPHDPPIISAEELKEKIDKNDDFILVDIQTVENYLKKHIPNSLSIPQEELTKRYKELPKDKEIIITSAGKTIDTCDLCTQGARTLISLGFSNVKNFKEGVSGWESKGYPIITGKEVTFKNMSAEKLKQKIEDHEDILILDIRDEKEYELEHIKGAVYMSFENIFSKKEELPKEKEIVIYDKVGHRSKLLTESLVKEGFLSATNLLDGFKNWKEKEYPIES